MDGQSCKYDLAFKFEAGTSRGVLRQKTSWFIQLSRAGQKGIGECGILKGLSVEDFDSFDTNLKESLERYCKDSDDFEWSSINSFPSIKFGLEIAEKDFQSGGNGILFDNEFSQGKKSIPINGLVWMGEYQFMYDQIKEKIDNGFNCIKLKIGALDFEKELSLLKYIRSEFDQTDIELRVDANGAFSLKEAQEKLKRLSEFHIHSIEQPIRPGQWEEMAILCENTPLPIALDEELIGITDFEQKNKLIQTILPQYIILKPSLIGGFVSSEEWMEVANRNKVGYWITSALESNIGLNAIAQWTYGLELDLPQGLGTGQLYHNNFEGPLFINDGTLHFNPEISLYQEFSLFD
jgi:o-succinylbenzoate synthase